MSTRSELIFTREQLFSDLQKDGITVHVDKINKARNGDGASMNDIGYEYHYKKRQYDKAMAWYRMAAVRNSFSAQNNIGVMYGEGLGVDLDYFTALEWYLKSAIQNSRIAWVNIGVYFDHGFGVPVNKFKALEWYYKSNEKPSRIKVLLESGIQFTQDDKNKPIEQLIMETEDIFWTARKQAVEELKERNKALQQSKTKSEDELNTKIMSLKEELQNVRVTAERKDQEMHYQRELLEQYKRQTHSFKLKSSIPQRELNDSQVIALEKQIASLCISSERQSQTVIKRIDELERYNQNFERLFEQERRLKDNEILLLKQEMQLLLNKEKEEKRILEMW